LDTVLDIELEEVMGKLSVANRVPGIEPFAKQNVPAVQSLFEDVPIHDGPLLEEVVLRMPDVMR
jgi:hypothetical protein